MVPLYGTWLFAQKVQDLQEVKFERILYLIILYLDERRGELLQVLRRNLVAWMEIYPGTKQVYWNSKNNQTKKQLNNFYLDQ